jgi:hypothetical protein
MTPRKDLFQEDVTTPYFETAGGCAGMKGGLYIYTLYGGVSGMCRCDWLMNDDALGLDCRLGDSYCQINGRRNRARCGRV